MISPSPYAFQERIAMTNGEASDAMQRWMMQVTDLLQLLAATKSIAEAVAEVERRRFDAHQERVKL